MTNGLFRESFFSKSIPFLPFGSTMESGGCVSEQTDEGCCRSVRRHSRRNSRIRGSVASLRRHLFGTRGVVLRSEPNGVSADQVRCAVSILFFLIYVFLIFRNRKVLAIWKAALSIGPIVAIQITIFFRLYHTPWLAAICVVLFGLVWMVWLKWINQPWQLWFAVGASTILALMYAWPQPNRVDAYRSRSNRRFCETTQVVPMQF